MAGYGPNGAPPSNGCVRPALRQYSAQMRWLPHPSNGNVLILDPDDVSPVPLRPEITDRHTRGEVSMLVGSPGVGKSTLGTSYAVAVAYENPAVIGQASIDWCGDVVIVSNEENHQTIRRRIRALRHNLGLSRRDQKHRIIIWPETLVLGQRSRLERRRSDKSSGRLRQHSRAAQRRERDRPRSVRHAGVGVERRQRE